MNDQSQNPERLLDSSATKAFQQLAAELRKALLDEAFRTANEGKITADDLEIAYKNLSFPNKESLQFADAQSVISQAIKENRTIEWLSYLMALILFVYGLVLLSIGLIGADVATRIGCLLGGSVVEMLILLPFRFAINSRRHNIAMRMLGLIINRVDDPKKLAPLLKDTFFAVVIGNPQFRTSDEK